MMTEAVQALKLRLRRYNDLKREQVQLEEELIKLETTMTSPKIQRVTDMPKGSKRTDPMLDIVARHIELQERYKTQIAQLLEAQIEIENIIENLEPRERQLARYRYLDGMTWEAICVAMRYSWKQIHRIHNAMLIKLIEGGETQ